MALILDGTNGVTTPTGTGDVSVGDDLTFTGTGNRITGDFSNATVANRVAFQTSTTNGFTAIQAIPNGTNTSSNFQCIAGSDVANASFGNFATDGTAVALQSNIRGTGTFLPMAFSTGGSERVRIDTSGNVGIGTSTPGSKFQVNGAITIGNADAGLQWLSSGSALADIRADGSSNLIFRNTSGYVERMRISSSGNLQVGHSANTGSRIFSKKDGQGDWNNRTITLEDTFGTSSQPGIGFHAAGNSVAAVFKLWGASNNFECRNAQDTGFVGILASAFVPSSDYRVKTDVVEVETALHGVMALRPVNYIKEGVKGREYGLIAHEVSPYFPDLVRGEKDAVRENGEIETQALDYMGLTSVLIKAIQEQQAIIEQLKADVAALKGAQA